MSNVKYWKMKPHKCLIQIASWLFPFKTLQPCAFRKDLNGIPISSSKVALSSNTVSLQTDRRMDVFTYVRTDRQPPNVPFICFDLRVEGSFSQPQIKRINFGNFLHTWGMIYNRHMAPRASNWACCVLLALICPLVSLGPKNC